MNKHRLNLYKTSKFPFASELFQKLTILQMKFTYENYACSENHVAFSCFLPQLLFFHPRKLYGNRFFQNGDVENVGLKSRISLGHTHF